MLDYFTLKRSDGKYWYPLLPRKSSENWFCTHLRNHRYDNRKSTVAKCDRAYRTWLDRFSERQYLSKFFSINLFDLNLTFNLTLIKL